MEATLIAAAAAAATRRDALAELEALDTGPAGAGSAQLAEHLLSDAVTALVEVGREMIVEASRLSEHRVRLLREYPTHFQAGPT